MRRKAHRKYLSDYRIASGVASLLGLTRFLVDVKIAGTDLDVAGYNAYTGQLHIAEIKRKLTDRNLQKAINQLYFREKIANRVWLVVPEKYVYFALALVPNRYGIIGYGSGNYWVARESRIFPGIYRSLVMLRLDSIF